MPSSHYGSLGVQLQHSGGQKQKKKKERGRRRLNVSELARDAEKRQKQKESDAAAAAVGRVLPRIVRAVQKVTGVGACHVLQNNGPEAGQEVMHVHFHVIPKPQGGGLSAAWNPMTVEPERIADTGRKIARLV